MKKFYLFFLLSSCLSLIIFPIFNYKKNVFNYREGINNIFKEQKNINNLENLVGDSITPACPKDFQISFNDFANNINEIDINVPKSRSWSRNLMEAYIDIPKSLPVGYKRRTNVSKNIILDKYKKRFEANVIFKNSNNELCELKAKIRIHGDQKDHLLYKNNNIRSSIDVTLKNGNIYGISKFKLFLPSTRISYLPKTKDSKRIEDGSSEVLISLLLQEMGYLSPRTKFLNLNFNDQSYKMIFQEKITKEMLEYNHLRESAILESDESLLWEIRRKGGTRNNNNLFPRIINHKWIKRNLINQRIGQEGANILSKAILESWNVSELDLETTFSDKILSNGNFENRELLSRYKAHLIASGTTHALINHNRRFYYDPINKSFIPIYYDGNSEIRELKEKLTFHDWWDNVSIMRDITAEDFDSAIDEIEKINLSKFALKLISAGVEIDELELRKIKYQLIKNLNYLKGNHRLTKEPKFANNPLKRKIQNQAKYGLILFSNSDRKFYLCNLEEDECFPRNLNEIEINQILTGDYIYDNQKYFFIGDKFDPLTKKYIDEKNKEFKLLNVNKNIYIKKYGNPKIEINNNKKLITIEIKNFNEKILFINSKLEGWDIKVIANKDNNFKKINSRIDTNLLTSLITIKDSYLENLKIYIEGGVHEDSLNIINSTGSIKKIDINNSFQDAIDFDFSNLKVYEINVKNAGNDCLDTSAGKYYVEKLNLNGCKDKGVSAGEASFLELKNAEIKNTKMALASKDSSELIIKSVSLENNDLCIAVYNKKQEFGPSYISIPNKLCNKDKLAIQNLSKIEIK